jgi:hypothetical protein
MATGCETVKGTAGGAASGLSQDVHNLGDSSKNGWNALERVDGWIQENMW